jgi:hypothetical protein
MAVLEGPMKQWWGAFKNYNQYESGRTNGSLTAAIAKASGLLTTWNPRTRMVPMSLCSNAKWGCFEEIIMAVDGTPPAIHMEIMLGSEAGKAAQDILQHLQQIKRELAEKQQWGGKKEFQIPRITIMDKDALRRRLSEKSSGRGKLRSTNSRVWN